MTLPKKMFMIYHGRFPAELGIAFFVAKMAEAFSDLGVEVIVLVPRRVGRTEKKSSEYFGTRDNFKVVFLPVLDFLFIKYYNSFFQRIIFAISLFTFSLFCLFYLIFNAKKEDLIHSNDTPPLLLASFFFPKTVYEVHNYPKAQKGYYTLLFNQVWKVIVTNRWKKEKIMGEFNISKDRIIYESNAVDFKLFDLNIEIPEARDILKLPKDKFIATYVGMLRTMNMEKGLSTVFSAIKRLPENFVLLLVGGKEGDIIYYKDLAKKEGIENRVLFSGFVKNSEVPMYLKASNVLLAPFPKNDHYEFYMSPMKIFEYMTSDRPIVTTNLTSIKEILGENSAIFTEAEDTKAIEEAILKIEKNKDFGLIIARKARNEIMEHSWDKRAERIVNFLY
jgi:glycosyltransferase involved in cell wall biosynthesis